MPGRPPPANPTATVWVALGCTLLLTAGCAGAPGPVPPADPAAGPTPRHRAQGPRLPAFLGEDPRARGWVKVDDLLWIDARDEEAWRRGEVHDGVRYRPRDSALPPGARATEGFRLRTDHVALRTNLPWDEAVALARAADAHCRRLIEGYGEALDLRLPADPLPVVAAATRAEFEHLLRSRLGAPLAWNAFYDARSGVVFVCGEPAREGALPLVADLRHEMTHQILDLTRPQALRGAPFSPPWFWLWEGFAMHAENLGDAWPREAGALRLERARRRLAWGRATPLADLVALPQMAFEGHHYDQAAAVVRFLMGAAWPGGREATLGVLRGLLARPAEAPDFEAVYGAPPAALDAAWRRAMGF